MPKKALMEMLKDGGKARCVKEVGKYIEKYNITEGMLKDRNGGAKTKSKIWEMETEEMEERGCSEHYIYI